MIDLKFKRERPSIEDYNNLFFDIYEEKRDEFIMKEAFNATLEFISVYSENDELIGFSRIIGDRTIFLYIHDVMVRSDYQSQGIGSKIIEETLNIIREYKVVNNDLRVYLGAAKDKESFYEKFGFLRRPNEYVGAGMILSPDFK